MSCATSRSGRRCYCLMAAAAAFVLVWWAPQAHDARLWRAGRRRACHGEYPLQHRLSHQADHGDAGTQTMAFYFADRRDGAVMFTNGDQGFQLMIPVIALLFEGTDLANFALSKR